jgi:RNA polymerase primary sigma factor
VVPVQHYAAWWIMQAVERSIAADHTIHVPQHAVEKRQKVLHAGRALAHSHRRPTAEQLATRSGLSVETVQKVLDQIKQPVSLEATVGPDGEGRLEDLLSDRDALTPDEAAARTQLQADLRGLLSSLTPREVQVLRMRFGLDGADEVTLEGIGATLSVSRERVRQIEERALAKLRASSEQARMKSHLG